MDPQIRDEIFKMLENKLREFVGPVARFVVSKQIMLIGKQVEDMDIDDVLKLIDMAAEAGIFDPEQRYKVAKDLKKAARKIMGVGG